MYNPQPDRSAEILTSANNQAAQINLAGMQSLGDSFAAMGDSLGDAFYKRNAQARENAAKADTNLGTAEALDSIYGSYGSPEQRQAFRDGLNKMSGNQDKTSGYIAMHVPTANALVELNKSKQIADIYAANNKDLAAIKAGNAAETAAAKEPKLDANYARQAYQSLRSRGYTHEQAIEGMNAGGMNWGVQYITAPDRGLSIMDQVLPNQTSPAPTR
jgi:hypothetical protein